MSTHMANQVNQYKSTSSLIPPIREVEDECWTRGLGGCLFSLTHQTPTGSFQRKCVEEGGGVGKEAGLTPPPPSLAPPTSWGRSRTGTQELEGTPMCIPLNIFKLPRSQTLVWTIHVSIVMYIMTIRIRIVQPPIPLALFWNYYFRSWHKREKKVRERLKKRVLPVFLCNSSLPEARRRRDELTTSSPKDPPRKKKCACFFFVFFLSSSFIPPVCFCSICTKTELGFLLLPNKLEPSDPRSDLFSSEKLLRMIQRARERRLVRAQPVWSRPTA